MVRNLLQPLTEVPEPHYSAEVWDTDELLRRVNNTHDQFVRNSARGNVDINGYISVLRRTYIEVRDDCFGVEPYRAIF